MQSPSEAAQLDKQRDYKLRKQNKALTREHSRNLKMILVCGSIVEVLTIALVIWIVHLGINQAMQMIPLAAAIFTIVSTPVITLLAYFQWRHPVASNSISSSGHRTFKGSSSHASSKTEASKNLQASSNHSNSFELATGTLESVQTVKELSMNTSAQLPDTRPLLLISYNEADRQMAEWINWQLAQEGYRTTLQADFVPGSNPTLKMDEALKQMQHALIILSPAYLHKNQAEWANIFRTDPTGRKLGLIPIYIQDCSEEIATGFLGGIMPIDLVGKKLEEARRILLQEIARSVNGKTVSSGEPPPFPGDCMSSDAQSI